MGFTSFFKRGDKAAAAKPVVDSPDGVQHLRVRARRRLIGAAVLVAVGVVGFPLLFETQPRPIPVDLPIDIPGKDKAPALNVPAAVLPSAAASKGVTTAGAEVIEGTEKVIEPQAKPVEPPSVEKIAEAKPDLKPEVKADKPEVKPEAKPQAKAEVPKPADKPKASRDDAARAQAILEGKSVEKPADKTAATDKGRFIVQVGAFADNAAAHEARMKVEKVGLKTYIQAVDAGGKHVIRVRIGPFADRSEADKAVAKLRGTGLATAVLTL